MSATAAPKAQATCAVCASSMVVARSTRRTCSDLCRQRLRRHGTATAPTDPTAKPRRRAPTPPPSAALASALVEPACSLTRVALEPPSIEPVSAAMVEPIDPVVAYAAEQAARAAAYVADMAARTAALDAIRREHAARNPDTLVILSDGTRLNPYGMPDS